LIGRVAVALLALAAIAYVLTALRARVAGAPPAAGERARLEDRKHAALAAIVDLEDERAIGKLSDADFEALAARYEAEALDALRALDAMGPPELPAADPEGSEDDPLEEEIAAARARLECPHCGAARRAPAACPRCGR
jgi:hypothetical protein